MKDLYVSTYRMNGREMVMIYTDTQHLHDHAGSSSEPGHWIGTIGRIDLAHTVAERLGKYGWASLERSVFDREHGGKLMSRER